MSACQRALGLPEICGLIVEHITPSYSFGDHHPDIEYVPLHPPTYLLEIALVSKNFLEPALNALWMFVPRLAQLFHLFPPSLCSVRCKYNKPNIHNGQIIEFRRDIVSADCERFDYYAHRIKSLSIRESKYDIDAQLIPQMLTFREPKSWFPRLESLWISDTLAEDPFCYARLFFSSRIKDLRFEIITLYPESLALYVYRLDILQRLKPKLRILICQRAYDIAPVFQLSPQISNQILDFVKGGALQRFVFTESASEEIQNEVVKHSNLEVLTLNIYYMHQSRNGLDFELPLRQLNDFRLVLRGASLTRLSIKVNFVYSDPELNILLAELDQYCDLSALEHIVFVATNARLVDTDSYDLRYVRQSNGMSMDIAPVEITPCEMLLSLLPSWKTLKKLEVVLPQDAKMGFSQKFVEQVAISCPWLDDGWESEHEELLGTSHDQRLSYNSPQMRVIHN
ncbi:hypothetical protein BT63DRAFT_453791 [Microthyrium microscopicum]|uniref:Uncharacterized protein n=1 Tax=Microthyrium microscopicum TaxID=703497 RepID=A0A6A6UGJ4_9PEZI|nr:hypothetical protein BT63DRAFT_453791 [Microthyrium microscopicum]